MRRPLIEIALNAKGKDENTSYQLRVSNLRRSDFKEGREANKWKVIKINANWKVKFAYSRSATNFTDIGELVCMLISSDGRTLRLKPTDFNSEEFNSIWKAIRSEYGLRQGQKGTFKNTKNK